MPTLDRPEPPYLQIAGRIRAEIVSGVGHFGPLEDPRLLARSIRSAFATEGPD